MPKTPFIETETYMLAGDVGGTKTLIGLFRPEKDYPVFDDIRIFSSAAYPDLESVVEEYLKTRQVRISGACFGIAGPVDKGKCRSNQPSLGGF
jgi:glucokinase